MKSKEKDRIGVIKRNNFNTPMQVIKYKDKDHIKVKFLDEYGYEVNCRWKNFEIGNVCNPYDERVCDLGFLGIDKNGKRVVVNSTNRRAYNTWRNMLSRCYNKDDAVYAYYGDNNVTVDKIWHCFANFLEWYNKNYYTVDNENMSLDKDIIIPNNKIYSPSTCVFVPKTINSLFTYNHNPNNKKDSFLPSGITISPKSKKKYMVQLSACGERINKSFYTEDEAIEFYISQRKLVILKIADLYKDKIPHKLYMALINYDVGISYTDKRGNFNEY